MMKVAIKHSELPNPREFVKSAPIPMPSQRGVKIQARNFNVYNASVPDREDIRKDNYSRRLQQMTSMGFSTPMNKPYKVIGDPLYLQQKDIILNGLGQLTYNQVKQEEKSSSRLDQTTDRSSVDVAKPVSKFSFGDLKNSKDLIDLPSEVNKIKNLIRCVKLGRGFFDLVKDQEKTKREKIESAKRASVTSMQIRPYQESDEDSEEISDDDDLDNDVSLRSFMDNVTPSAIFYNNSNKEDEEDINNNSMNVVVNDHHPMAIPTPLVRTVTFNMQPLIMTDDTTSDTGINIRPHTVPAFLPTHPKFKKSNLQSAQSNRNENNSQSRLTTTSKKRRDSPKPYTPIYSSLLSKTSEPIVNKESFVRQLSVLLWLLESINCESQTMIAPLRSCFQIREISANKSSDKISLKLKSVENDWNNFKKEPVVPKATLKPWQPKEDKSRQRRKTATMFIGVNDSIMTEDTLNDDELDSLRLIKPTPDTPTSEMLNTMTNDLEVYKSIKNKRDEMRLSLTGRESFDNAVQQMATPSVVNNSETNRDLSDSVKDGLVTSTVRESMNLGFSVDLAATNTNRESTAKEQTVDRRKRKPISLRQNLKTPTKEKQFENTLTEHEKQLLKIGDPDELEHLFSKINYGKTEKKSSRELRADNGPIHALWTENVINYQRSLPSAKKSAKMQEIRDQFKSVTDENAIILHNRLEELERKRLSNCLTKYNVLDFKERGIHKMMNKMNKCIAEKQRLEDLRKSNSQYHEWFLEIEEIVEMFSKNDDPVMTILLDKLASYAKVNAKKMNETAFFKTLDTLRVWELLSPEVMTAVEFCRERILGIPLDQFDAWFMSKHPQSFVPRKVEAPEQTAAAAARRVKSSILIKT